MNAFNRRIKIRTRTDAHGRSEARAALEDDMHHFRVHVLASDGVIDTVTGEALRHPTVLCPSAIARLQELLEMVLSPYSYSVTQHTDARQQCTHLIDLAGLAIAAMANGNGERAYWARVTDVVSEDTVRKATLQRDGAACLEWRFVNGVIADPAYVGGVSLESGFTRWATTLADSDASEAALVLRRAIFVAGGRDVDLDVVGNHRPPQAGCWVWQPERADEAHRVVGSTLDFANRPNDLLTASKRWLEFMED
ncbi:MAG: hypothetical protein AAGC77_08060 [Pseudomonadota bacterium]